MATAPTDPHVQQHQVAIQEESIQGIYNFNIQLSLQPFTCLLQEGNLEMALKTQLHVGLPHTHTHLRHITG